MKMNLIKRIPVAAILCLLCPLLAKSATFRWVPASNRIVVEHGGSATLSDIKAALPAAPLDLVDPINRIWLLRADLFVKDGSVLVLHGAGGDVNEFRLQSMNTVAAGSVVSVVADYGSLDISDTRIISWDSLSEGPDTEYLTFGRAHVLVRSSLSTNGVTPLESRMNITNSEIAYLGYNAADSYGLVWKVGGTAPTPTNSIYDVVNVYGNIVNSHIHDNYYGIYALGASGMLCSGNEIHGNAQFGVNLQDDSDSLVIQGNNIHHNGNHGLQASDRCDHLTLRNNVSRFNAKSGILLFRNSNDSVIENNECSDNGENGLVLTASSRGTVRGNKLLRNLRAGMQLDLGSADNQVENNQSSSNALSGITLLKGSGTPEPGNDGRPKRNVFVGNLIQDNADDPVTLTDSDDNVFATNSFRATGVKLRFKRGLRNLVDGNTIPADLPIRTEGDTNLTASTIVRRQPFFRVELNTNGTLVAQDSSGQICQPDENFLITEISANGTSLPMTSAEIGGSSTVTARNFFVSAAPGDAFLNNLVWAPAATTRWSMMAGSPGQTLNFHLGDLVASTNYVVRKANGVLTNLNTDASGQLQFSDVAATTDPVVYSLVPANPTPPTTISYSANLNRISVRGAMSATLSDIKSALPAAPLDLVDAPNKIWLLRADLQVNDGGTLVLHGSGAGGDVNELRLLSLDTGATGSVVSVTADWGIFDIDSTKITSWNTDTGEPDTNSLAFGRAYLRVRSSLSTNGVTPLESRMDIKNSEIAYLGYNASDSYGLVWKVGGSAPTNSIFDLVNVYGNVVNSHIHDNYIGAYTVGAFGMQWLTNEVDHNEQYGLDLQSDSDQLLIQGNSLHHNGNHGLLASVRCDHLQIEGNLCWANLQNGILLDRSSDDAVIEANQCFDNADSGIVLSASSRSQVRNNGLLRNLEAGLRLSLGSADNLIENNQSVSNSLYGIQSQLGSGTPNPGDDGRPKRNTFTGNLIQGNGVEPVRMADSDDNKFANNTFTDIIGKLRFQRGLRNQLDGNSLPATLAVRTEGDTNALASTYVRNQILLKVELDMNGSAIFEDAGGRIYQPDEGAIPTQVSANGTLLSMTPAEIGGSSMVTARNFHASASPGTALLHHLVWTNGTSKQWSVTSDTLGQSLGFAIGDLMADSSYAVLKAGAVLTNLQSDASGQIMFLDSVSVTNAVVYFLDVFDTNNVPPLLRSLPDRVIAEMTPLIVTNTATDSNWPANILTYALQSAPSNSAITTNGIITWTPTEAQGPGTYIFTTVVSDDGVPSMSVTNSFAVVVNEINRAPQLPAQADRTIGVMTTLVVNNAAIDPDMPSSHLQYSLISAPGNAAISPSGMITWTPTASQGPSTNTFTTVVTDDGAPPLAATNSFTVFVIGSPSTLDPNLPPGGNFDLTHWRLTLPDATATDILAPGLVSGFYDPTYFYTDTDGAMKFWCPVTGGTTQGSEFPRTELREMLDPNDSGVNWTGYGAHRLDAQCKVTQVPDRKRVIIGQIHSYTVATFPLLKLEFVDGALEAKVKLSPYDATNEFKYTFGKIGLGDLISYRLQLADGIVSMTVNGITHTVNIFESDPAWTNQTFYFKAGNYCQDNAGPATEGSAVSFYQLHVAHSFTSNTAPSLTALPDLTIAELTPLVVTNTASDPDTINVLSYVLQSGPANAVISDVGVISWTPTEAQGPSTNVFTTVVIDDGLIPQSATNTFVVIVTEANSAPTLPVQTDAVIPELTTLVVTNTAADPDLPANLLSYVLQSGPANAVISAEGVITWTPTEAQGPSTNVFTTVVTDDVLVPLSATNTFVVIVTEANSAPTLPVQTEAVIPELTTLVVTNTAADPDLPSNLLSYALQSGPPNAVISAEGVITWTPTEAQGPSTNVFTTVATDDGLVPSSATNTFVVIVTEANSTPTLPVQTDAVIPELTTLVVTNTAADPDLPANLLTYALQSGPANAVISAEGVITWTPSEAQGPSTNVFTTVVTDDGLVPLSATNTFVVIVTEGNSTPTLPVQTDAVIPELSTLVVTNTAADPDLPANLLSYALQSGPANAVISTEGVITWTPSEAQGPSTNVFTTVVTDDGLVPLSATNTFVVIVTEANSAPTLRAHNDVSLGTTTSLLVNNAAADVDVPAQSLTYTLASAPANAVISAGGIITWTPGPGQSPSTNVFTTVVTDNGAPPLSATNSFTVFVPEPPPAQPVVVQIQAGERNSLVLTWSSPASNWVLQESASLEAPDWTNSTNSVQILSGQQYQVVVPAASHNTFFRLIQP